MSPAEKSFAIAQVSMGPDKRTFPLFPPIVRGAENGGQPYQFPLEISFDYSHVNPALFAAIGEDGGILRWRSLLPPLVDELSMGEGGTPLLDVSSCANQADVRVYLKDESRNPTFSHKDRLNLCTISAAKLSGAQGVIAASTGNHGISTAAYAARAGIRCVILVPERFSKSYFAALNAYGADSVAVVASKKWEILGRFVDDFGFHPTSNLTKFHTGHPFGPEGYKTIAYEIYSQLKKVPAAVVVPTGYAELLFGIVKGFQELIELGVSNLLPQAFSVEPAALAPLAKALKEGLPMTDVTPSDTQLNSIACSVSGYRGVWALSKSNGAALTVTDQHALMAQAKYARAGLWQELSSAAALAAVDVIASEYKGKDIVVIGTSSGTKDPIDYQLTDKVCSTYEDAVAYLSEAYGYYPEDGAK